MVSFWAIIKCHYLLSTKRTLRFLLRVRLQFSFLDQTGRGFCQRGVEEPGDVVGDFERSRVHDDDHPGQRYIKQYSHRGNDRQRDGTEQQQLFDSREWNESTTRVSKFNHVPDIGGSTVALAFAQRRAGVTASGHLDTSFDVHGIAQQLDASDFIFFLLATSYLGIVVEHRRFARYQRGE